MCIPPSLQATGLYRKFFGFRAIIWFLNKINWFLIKIHWFLSKIHWFLNKINWFLSKFHWCLGQNSSSFLNKYRIIFRQYLFEYFPGKQNNILYILLVFLPFFLLSYKNVRQFSIIVVPLYD